MNCGKKNDTLKTVLTVIGVIAAIAAVAAAAYMLFKKYFKITFECDDECCDECDCDGCFVEKEDAEELEPVCECGCEECAE